MFFDYLRVKQEYSFQLPRLGNEGLLRFNLTTGEKIAETSANPRQQYKGSHSTVVDILVTGNRLVIDGNPSRINRADNLHGLISLDSCFDVYNEILSQYDLPKLTKCTEAFPTFCPESGKHKMTVNGAVLERLDLTENKSVGQGNVDAFLRALSMIPYRNSKPFLYPNGKTVGWHSADGGNGLVYPSVYDKAYDLNRKARRIVKRLFGENSPEYRYITNLIDYCKEHGVARFEQKLHAELLTREGLKYWGLFDPSGFRPIHESFMNIEKKLQVNKMTLETIAERLLREGHVNSTKSANAVSNYAYQWMEGRVFDLSKSEVRKNRSILRKIGIDIMLPCDLTKFALTNVVDTKEVKVTPLILPDWYQHPVQNRLRLVA
jgi:hypothetical protein